MRIRRLQVRDLRRYRELDIDLAPGVTVVRGPNEAGKTHDPARHRARPDPPGDEQRRRPRGAPAVGRRRRDARPWVAIEFEQEEEDGRLATGTLEKSFGGQKGTVDLEYDGQRVTDPTLADQVLAELTGIPTESFFRSTASVRHHELSDLARDETRAARPAPGQHQRRRPRHRPGQEEARAGDPRADDQGRQEPRPAQGRRGGRRPDRARLSRRASSRWPSSSGTATRCPAPANGGPRRSATLAERRGDAREGAPGRAPRGRAHRRPRALRAVPRGGRGRRPSSTSSPRPIRRRTRCRSSARRSSGCACSTRRIARAQRRARRRDRGPVRGRAGADLAAAVALGRSSPSSSGWSSPAAASCSSSLEHRSTSARPRCTSAARSPASA